MWTIPGRPVPLAQVPSLSPVETLYDFEGPRLFVTRDSDGEPNLVYWCDESVDFTRYIVVPTSPDRITALKTGELTVRSALDQPRCRLVDLRPDGTVAACHFIDFESLPSDVIPSRGTLLFADLEQRTLDLEGTIRALDTDAQTFDLRDISDTRAVQRFRFTSELLTPVFDCLRDNRRVRVHGRFLPPADLPRALSLAPIPAANKAG